MLTLSGRKSLSEAILFHAENAVWEHNHRISDYDPLERPLRPIASLKLESRFPCTKFTRKLIYLCLCLSVTGYSNEQNNYDLQAT